MCASILWGATPHIKESTDISPLDLLKGVQKKAGNEFKIHLELHMNTIDKKSYKISPLDLDETKKHI